MKSFKEFQNESYSRLDEGIAGNILTRVGGAWIGKDAYDALVPDIRGAMPGKDGKKVKSTKSNWKGQVLGGIVGGVGDQIVKKGWKYGVKPTYSLAKWGVTKGIPGAISTTGKIITALGAMNKMH